MTVRLSRHFSVKPSELKSRGVFDAHLGIDNKLFVDPKLLKTHLRIPEFAGARRDLTTYFSKVIKLIKASQKEGDIAWVAARARMTFKEEHGAALGYSGAGSYGKAVGPHLANILVKRAKEILVLGIDDPEMFELIGLFQEDIGADLLSDMAVSILRTRFLNYTERVTRELNLQPSKKFDIEGQTRTLPILPGRKRPLILVPKALLSKLPIALDRSEIDEVAVFNRSLRHVWNAIVAAARDEDVEVSKEQIREMLFAHPKNLADLIRVYREAAVQGYNFEKDPDGLLSWDFIGRAAAKANPLEIGIKRPASMEELRKIVELILKQFKRNIEENGLYEFLYKDNGKPRNEKFAQRLFYSVADAYCEANNVDLSREPNAGNGPVDFKLSTGYRGRRLVEIKKSSNGNLVHGYESQLPDYERSEATEESVYLIIRVADRDSTIKRVLSLRDQKIAAGQKVPDVFVIDARKKASASKRRRIKG